ncbi:MAG TPA: hypothetical protein VFI42_10020 [Thermomicrobiaceae bacterium]|nr:hypothetical protein [Thermomicrobiaceae bacterium]
MTSEQHPSQSTEHAVQQASQGKLNYDFDGITLHLTGDRQLQFDYEPSDMRVAYRRSTPSSWQDIISWMEKKGTFDNEFTPGEVVAMVEDLRSLKQGGEQFTDNPDQAFQEAHQHRGHNNQQHQQLHQEILAASAQGPNAR